MVYKNSNWQENLNMVGSHSKDSLLWHWARLVNLAEMGVSAKRRGTHGETPALAVSAKAKPASTRHPE